LVMTGAVCCLGTPQDYSRDYKEQQCAEHAEAEVNAPISVMPLDS
jgi:hypothetical protein